MTPRSKNKKVQEMTLSEIRDICISQIQDNLISKGMTAAETKKVFFRARTLQIPSYLHILEFVQKAGNVNEKELRRYKHEFNNQLTICGMDIILSENEKCQ